VRTFGLESSLPGGYILAGFQSPKRRHLGLSPACLIGTFGLESSLYWWVHFGWLPVHCAGAFGLESSLSDWDIGSGFQPTWTCEQVTSHMMGTLVWSPVYLVGTCELGTSLPDRDIVQAGVQSTLRGHVSWRPAYVMGKLVWCSVYMARTSRLDSGKPGESKKSGLESNVSGMETFVLKSSSMWWGHLG
jgi:hypothetical protein